MPAATPFYGLSYFLFGDDLEDAISVDAERSRFVFIDKQIYGLFNIFGNGVVSGWDIKQNVEGNKFTIIIESGYGFVDGQFAQTTENVYIENLEPNSTYYVMAKKDQNTDETNRDVIFTADTYITPFTVFLGIVVVGEEGITNINTLDRTVISFLQIIKDEIAKHRHRGQPTKIDLQSEVKNQLSGARIKDIDTSKIVSGRFDVNRIPQLNHEDLGGTGLLTHAALDSFARLITNGNQQLLGEISSVNTIKLITAQHYFANDLGVDISKIVEFPNLQLCLPGVTKDSIIDFAASTANINLVSRCISGQEVKQGAINSIYYQDNAAFFSAFDRRFVAIALDTVQLIRGGSTALEIEGFKTVTNGGIAVSNFTVDVEIVQNNTSVNNGVFTGGVILRTKYTKIVEVNNDWRQFDELLIDVKSLAITHGAVYLYVINGTGADEVRSQDFLLLNVNEITDGPDANVYGFVRKIFNISQVTRNNIRKIIVYTDDSTANQVFYLDTVFIRASTLYPSLGSIRFRHSSASPVTFNNVNYDADIPSGCDIRVRARVANSPSLLLRTDYTLALNSGDVFALTGTDIEIEVVLVSNTDRTQTPVFKGMELQYIIDSVDSGFTIQSSNMWNKGRYLGAVAEQDSISVGVVNLQLQQPLAVGEYYYLFENGVNQNASDGTAKVGFRGLSFANLLSTKQCLDIVYNRYVAGFNSPKSVYRLISKNYIVADTANDRILEVNRDGQFIRGIGSHNLVDEDGFYPLNAVFNPRNGILSICFSQEIDLETFEITKVKLWIDNSFIFLSEFDTVVDSGKPKTILEIQLTTEKIEQLDNIQNSAYVDLTSGIFTDAFAFVGNARRLLSTRGLPLFVGDFVYSSFINKPVYANINSKDNAYVCNSKIKEEFVPTANAQTIIVTVGTTVTKKAQAEKSDDPAISFVSWDSPQIPSAIASIVTTQTQNDPLDPSVLEITINNPTEDLIVGSPYTINLTANYSNGSSRTSLVIRIIAAPDPNAEPKNLDIASVVELDFADGEAVYTNNLLYFSEFTLGSVFEIDGYNLLISGLYDIEESLPIVETNDPSETYEQQAIRKLTNSAGKTIIINKNTNAVIFEYFSPDGLYPSDAIIDSRGQVVVAESAFSSNAGRVVKIDDSNNITWQVGFGLFTQVNDIRAKYNNDIIIST